MTINRLRGKIILGKGLYVMANDDSPSVLLEKIKNEQKTKKITADKCIIFLPPLLYKRHRTRKVAQSITSML